MNKLTTALTVLTLALASAGYANSNRFLEGDLRANCASLYPENTPVQSICLNATGACVSLYMIDRKGDVAEDQVLPAIEACTKLQYQANAEYMKWAEGAGVLNTYKKYMSGALTFEEATQDQLFLSVNECRVSSKTHDYTNYVKMWECIQKLKAK